MDPFFVHLSYNDYTGIYLGKPEDGLTSQRMVPPGYISYFYSSQEEPCVAEDQLRRCYPLKGIRKVKIVDEMEFVEMNEINYINIAVNKRIIGKYYEPQVQVLPRSRDLVYIPPKRKKQKKVWTFPISLFKDWRKDDEELVGRCFEADWSASRIGKIIKNEEDVQRSKEFLRGIYP